MGHIERIVVELNEDEMRIVRDAVSAGLCASEADVLRAGIQDAQARLDALAARRAERDELREAIRKDLAILALHDPAAEDLDAWEPQSWDLEDEVDDEFR